MNTHRSNDATTRGTPSRRPRGSGHAGKARAVNGGLLQKLLILLGEEKTVRLDLAAALLGVGPDELRPVIAEGIAAGFLQKEAFLRDEPAKYPWLWLTRNGLVAAGLASRYFHVPSEGILKHTRGVHKIRLHWARQRPGALWVPERELSRRNDRTKRHLADGALEEDGRLVPIEYERTGKGTLKLLHGMCELLRRHGHAYYYCSDETRDKVTAVRDSNNLEGIEVLELPEFPDIA